MRTLHCLKIMIVSSLLTVITVAIPVNGLAGVLSVKILPQAVTLAPGQTVVLTLVYDVPQGIKKTMGLGLRLYFDSSAIEQFSLKESYGEGLVAVDEIAQHDTDNGDRDSLTDQYIGMAWIGVANEWPSMDSLPVSLGKIVIKARSGKINKDSMIRIIPTGLPDGYELQKDEAVIRVR